MKVWITKYALTEGIFQVNAEKCSDTSPNMIGFIRENSGFTQYAHGEGRDWHLTKESALARSENMRLAKIKSHKNAIKRLEQMSFVNEKRVAKTTRE